MAFSITNQTNHVNKCLYIYVKLNNNRSEKVITSKIAVSSRIYVLNLFFDLGKDNQKTTYF